MTKRRMEIAVQAEQHSICNFWKCKIFINQNMSSIIYSSSFCWDIYGMYILRTQVRLLATQLTDLGPFRRLYSKGLRAESARAVTGRWCPHSGEGGDFLMGQLNFFSKTAVTPERNVEKWIPRWEINRHAEGWKWVIDQNWGRMAKIGFLDQKPRFWAQKNVTLFQVHHVLATTGKSCSKKKSAFAQIIKVGYIILGDFLGAGSKTFGTLISGVQWPEHG